MLSEDMTAVISAEEDFILLCEQVAFLAEEIEKMDRLKDPDGPNGWELRPATVIKENVLKILNRARNRPGPP